MSISRVARASLLLSASLVLSGCFGLEGKMAPGFTAPPPPEPPLTALNAPIPANPAISDNRGAIYQSTDGYANLVTGTRARRLGDMVTIVLVENTNSSKSASGDTQRDGSFSLTPPTSGPLSFINPNALNPSGQGSFSGSGSAAQQSQLSGTVAVTIAAIYPNGTAEVVGEKQMSLSQGNEWVQFAGRIRLVDIDADNRLASSQVANARIIYSGKGAVQQASKPGWLSRFFNMISPL
ncbi:flagellar basal body L-ring protein FlgH [Erythrobacter sp. YT30]|uniref:flagellar basal body L-ring protein FlgH n=1 Tax=Erythrobacter sp. YT30 TaxID=1735012 RepID=UPI00076CA584|nr:flagellar basal body L-ring protein FlgH [Erythrobacter sp. YT30]KWV91671.1 flagellar biosynthesis protein FlgH [Erythrobacter sp. YT30]